MPAAIEGVHFTSGALNRETGYWGTGDPVRHQEHVRDVLGFFSSYTSGIWEVEWRDTYPELCDYITYVTTVKGESWRPMFQLYDNLVVNTQTPLEAIKLPPDNDITPDPVYGHYGNNIYLEYDPGFSDYARGQLSPQVAAELGIEWIDMSRIGARR